MNEYAVQGRLFQLWSFEPTHSRLILQSNSPNALKPRVRIEVLFAGVEYAAFPPNFRDLRLRRADEQQRAAALAAARLERPSRGEVYLLHPRQDWFVISGPPSWAEADLDYDQPSVFTPQGFHSGIVFHDLA